MRKKQRLKSRSTLRPRHRYIVFKVHSEGKLDYRNVESAVWNSLENWLGEQDLALAGLKLVRNLWNPGTQTGFLRCTHTYADRVKVGLALIHQIGDERVAFQTLRVSGTIKSAKDKLG